MVNYSSASIVFKVWDYAYFFKNVGLGDGAYFATIELQDFAEEELYE
jgi:hypothetical protein